MPNRFYFNFHIYQMRWFQQRVYVSWLCYHRRRHRHNHMAHRNIKTRTTQNIENVVQRSVICCTFEDTLKWITGKIDGKSTTTIDTHRYVYISTDNHNNCLIDIDTLPDLLKWSIQVIVFTHFFPRARSVFIWHAVSHFCFFKWFHLNNRLMLTNNVWAVANKSSCL